VKLGLDRRNEPDLHRARVDSCGLRQNRHSNESSDETQLRIIQLKGDYFL
jgi:hypothetical protein